MIRVATESARGVSSSRTIAIPVLEVLFAFGPGRSRLTLAIEDAAVLARCLADDTQAPARALQRYQSLRIGRTTRLQQVSHARAHVNHLPDGPEQEARDRSLAAADPLAASAWIHAYDAETAAAEAGPCPGGSRSSWG
jgi:salicylate hydroxylase